MEEYQVQLINVSDLIQSKKTKVIIEKQSAFIYFEEEILLKIFMPRNIFSFFFFFRS
jgi:hypothetical protein